MSAVAAPNIEMTVTPNAAEEVKKFMAGEDDLPETAGLRVRVVPGGCSGFQYSLNIEEESRQGRFYRRTARGSSFCRYVQRAVSQRHHD